MNHSTPGLHVHHQLPEFTQTHVRRVGDAIQPSHPLSSPSLPPIPPSIRVSSCMFLSYSPFFPLSPSHVSTSLFSMSASPLLPCGRNALGITFYFILLLSCINTQYYISFSLQHSNPNFWIA